MNRYRMHINGEAVEARRGAWFPVYDPSTEEVIAEAPDADEQDVNRAVEAARSAFESGAWPQTTEIGRAHV
jgi:betaine-aldehyde dehydrogenase